MTQTWHDLLFAHWRCDPAAIVRHVPPALELDTFDGAAWLGIVPFRMTNVAPRGVPALPGLSAFPELNVRTYVRVHGRAGVYFFSLDAANPLAVVAARTLFGLPYFVASMDVARDDDGGIRYHSRRVGTATPAELTLRYRPSGEVFIAARGTLEWFLAERYCLFTADRRGRVRTVDIHHPPWPLQTATATIAANTMARAAGIDLPGDPPLLHFARRQDVVVWTPRAVS
jgi:uncharacterized protein YqjF (DUF2071 family)